MSRILEASFVTDGAPERFVPETMRGQLVEAEHLARYWWAAEHVEGRVVLDAGCGTGYGSRILADAGASQVVGVDCAEEVLEAARPSMPSKVVLEVGDVRALAYPDETFDAVVCFEVIEHVEEQETALDELARVLKPSGFLLISSPNRDVYVPGNPYHTREFTPDDLVRFLGKRFHEIRLFRQHDWISSAVLSDDLFRREARLPLHGLRAVKVAARELGAELYTVAAAGNERLPEFGQVLCMTHELEFRRWLELYDEIDAAARELRKKADLADRLLLERRRLGEQLRQAEQIGARVAPLEAELRDREQLVETMEALNEQERAVLLSERDTLAEELRLMISQLEADIEEARTDLTAVRGSISWRVTRPLRVGKAALRELRSSRLARWIRER